MDTLKNIFRKSDKQSPEPAAPKLLPMTEDELLVNTLELTEENTSNVLSIQIASDLHIEFLRENGQWDGMIEPSAPVLALLGDIGTPGSSETGPYGKEGYRKFLFEQAENFEHVLVLTGNHEYYINNANQLYPEFSDKDAGSPATMLEVDQLISDICAERQNLHFLNCNAVLLNGVRVIGTTLWSHVPEDSELDIQMRMNDYQRIFVKNDEEGKGAEDVRNITAQDTNSLHELAVRFIKTHISKACEEHQKVLVLTHHTPIMKGSSAPQYDDSPMQCGFSTDLGHLLDGKKVNAWAFGHTHYNNDLEVNGVRVFANQHGYIHQRKDDYKPNFVVEI